MAQKIVKRQPVRQLPKKAEAEAKASPESPKEKSHHAAKGVRIVKSTKEAIADHEKAADAQPETVALKINRPDKKEVIKDISIEDITVIPDPHRTESESEEKETIFELARSIQDVWFIQPLVVNATKEGGYELVAGRKRLKAAGILGLDSVPCLIKNYDEVHSEMAMLGENLIRTAYKRAAYDKAIARYATLYEQLHPETKKGKAGGHARAAKVAAKGGKVTAKPAPSFSRTVAKRTGVSPRKIEKARKRGTTFTDDDTTVFSAHGVKIHDQDMIAAVADTKKRAAIIKQIAEGVPAEKAYQFIMLPAGAKVDEIPGETGEGGAPLSDEAWLAQCPIRGQVVKKMFDVQALVYRRCLEGKLKLEKVFNQARKEFKGMMGGQKGYPAHVSRFLKTRHPKEWVVCGTCGGKGVTKIEGKKDMAVCSGCDGGGFVV